MSSYIHEPFRTRKPHRVDYFLRRKRLTRRFATKAEAERFAGDLASGRRVDASRMTLDAWLIAWARAHGPGWVKRTRDDRGDFAERLIAPHLGKLRLFEIGRLDVRDWRADLRRNGETAYTANRAVSVLSAALGAAVEDGLLASNPCAGLRRLPEPPRLVVPATLAEVEGIRALLQRPRDRAIVSLLAYAGLRPGELVTFAWADVGKSSLVVRTAVGDGAVKGTKTGSTRTVPLILPLRDDLQAVKRTERTVAGHLDWPNWRNRVWRPAREAVGFLGRPYDLRHTFASLLIAEGRSVHEVARLLGHSTPRLTLETYGHLFDEAQLRRNESIEKAAIRARHRASTSRKAAPISPRGRGRRPPARTRGKGAVGKSSGRIR